VAAVTKLDCHELVDKEDPQILLQQKEHLASPKGQSPRCLRTGFFLDGPGESCRTKPPQPHHGRDHGGPPQCPTALLQCRRTSIHIVGHGAGDIINTGTDLRSRRGRRPPGIRRGTWSPAALGLPTTDLLKPAIGRRPATHAGDMGGGGRRKEKGKRGEPADPHPRLARQPTGRPPPAPLPPASPTVTKRRQALGAAAG
jgi:hypothetical protein